MSFGNLMLIADIFKSPAFTDPTQANAETTSAPNKIRRELKE
jgi:hypothetical protein